MNLPNMRIEVVQNGYVLHVYDNGLTQGEFASRRFVATTHTGLFKAIKMVAVEARLCGNNPPG